MSVHFLESANHEDDGVGVYDIKWLCIFHLVLRLAKTPQSRQHEDKPASIDSPVRASGPGVPGIRTLPQCTADVLANLEHYWFYGRSPAVYPTCKCYAIFLPSTYLSY